MVAVLWMIQTYGCTKTIQWEEEVQLNTHEIVLLKHKVEYNVQGGAGNPFDFAYRPKSGSHVMEFDWNGRHYVFNLEIGIMLLAISPQKQPVLLAPAESRAWEAVNHYKCTIPFYVQFIPDSSGRNWTWPSRIEPWLYNLDSNLLVKTPEPGRAVRHYSLEHVKTANANIIDYISNYRRKVDPNYSGDRCRDLQKQSLQQVTIKPIPQAEMLMTNPSKNTDDAR